MNLPFNRHRLFKVLKWVTDGASGGWEPGMEPDPMANLEETEDLNTADIIASEAKRLGGFQSKHMVMFDVDIPIVVVPSTTPGHSHVYFPNTYIPKEHLFEVLDVLANVGIVEPGYVAASKARGFTALRLPWVRKANRPVAVTPFDDMLRRT